MRAYSTELVEQIKELRAEGRTYVEIQAAIGEKIPKSSLSYMCKSVVMSSEGKARIENIVTVNRNIARLAATAANRRIFNEKLEGYRVANAAIAENMRDHNSQLIALAMLYLGEGAKWQKSRAPKLGSSNPDIIRLYIDLLDACYGVGREKLRCRVQHRADQDSAKLISYWSSVTGVDSSNFYKSYVDKRTIGKVTTKSSYKGVCTVHCSGTHIQLELSEIADIISKSMRGVSSVG